MKTLLKAKQIILVSFFLNFNPFNARTQEVQNIIVKTKEITQDYQVINLQSLSINNSSGDLHIRIWDKNEISISIKITGRSFSYIKSQDIVDNVSFDVIHANDSIKYTTIIKTPYNNKNSINSILDVSTQTTYFEATVDYIIYIPDYISLTIFNSAGDIYIGDFGGYLNLELHHGEFYHQNLSGKNNRINVYN